jgi:hypothetical protein
MLIFTMAEIPLLNGTLHFDCTMLHFVFYTVC